MPDPLRIAFLGCGFITRVHSRHLRSLRGDIIPLKERVVTRYYDPLTRLLRMFNS